MLSIQEQVLTTFENLKVMLRERGLDIAALDAMGPKELDALSTTQNIFTLEVNPSLSVVFYLTKMKISEFKSAMFGKSKDIEDEDIAKNDDKLVIFIFKEDVSAQNRKSINTFFKSHQVFQISELMFNVSRHSLVPKHEVMRDEAEIKDMFTRYHVKGKSQLPAIHQSDPMAKYLGLVPGDIVRITRPSPTCGSYEYFRVCVP